MCQDEENASDGSKGQPRSMWDRMSYKDKSFSTVDIN